MHAAQAHTMRPWLQSKCTQATNCCLCFDSAVRCHALYRRMCLRANINIRIKYFNEK